jgi:hypothetical protein
MLKKKRTSKSDVLTQGMGIAEVKYLRFHYLELEKIKPLSFVLGEQFLAD